jgi:methyl-accepting chemotaxis protein PixJ
MLKPREQVNKNNSKIERNFTGSRSANWSDLRSNQQWRGLRFRITSLAVAIGVIPVLIVGIIAFISNLSARGQLSNAHVTWEISKFDAALQQQWLTLLLWTGITAGIAAAIATYIANRAIRPLISAANASTRMINRLRQEEMKVRDISSDRDELKTLQNNLRLLEQQLPELLWKQEAGTESVRLVAEISRRLRESHSQEDVLRTTVEQVREAFRADRVAVFRFGDNWHGTFVEESVAPGLPKTLWAKIDDSAIEEEDLESYRQGNTRAISNIYEADLGDRYLGILERFAVKANLIAPIFKKSDLFGLLIAHQCSSPRDWQKDEVDLFNQIATQVGLMLEQANLIEQLETKTEQVQIFTELTRRIRKSFDRDDILRTTVEEVRKEIKADRILVCSIEPYDSILAESAGSGVTKALSINFDRGCLLESYGDRDKNKSDRVVKIDNLDRSNLSPSCLGQLRKLDVKAILIAPLFREEQLFGLLIAQDCSKPRQWQQSEVDLLGQIAIQVGFALDRATLLQQIETEKNQNETIFNFSRRIGQTIDEEDILSNTVEDVRREIRADRVVIYSFNPDWSGYISAESVVPGWRHALDRKIEDPCIPEELRQAYINGRIVATDNVFEAGFHPNHLKLMESLQIKSNLVTPILKDGKLFGLLIAHHCSQVHSWQKLEIDLLAQIAIQVGFALDRSRLLAKIEAERSKTQLMRNMTQNICASLNEENVIQTAVDEVRKALKTDRTIIYSFDEDWYGTVIAESVLPGYAKTLWANIKDPCFAENYVEQYQNGRVQATNNIYKAGLTQCHLKQLEPYGVKANLVAPILKDDKLFGLLIAHNCSEPRNWQQSEIDLFAQIAFQIGFALDRARLLTKLEQNYSLNRLFDGQQLQELSQLAASSKIEMESLANKTNEQSTSIDRLIERLKALTNNAQTINTTAREVQTQQQELKEAWKMGMEAIEQIIDRSAAMHLSIAESSEKLEQQQQSCENSISAIAPIANGISQIQLQAMNAMLEASRTGESGRQFAAIAEQIHTLAKQMEQDIIKLDPIITLIRSNAKEVGNLMAQEIASIEQDTQLIGGIQAKLDRFMEINTQFNLLITKLIETINERSSHTMSVDLFLEQALELSQQTSTQSAKLLQSWQKLAAIARDLDKD